MFKTIWRKFMGALDSNGSYNMILNQMQNIATGNINNKVNENQEIEKNTNGAVNKTTQILEEWRDQYRKMKFRHKSTGAVEIVKYTIEDQGKFRLIFESGNECPEKQLTNSYLPLDTDVNQAYNAAKFNEPDKDLNLDEVSQKQKANIHTSNRAQTKNVAQPQVITNPLFEIFKKLKNNPVDAVINLKLNIPDKNTFDILNSSFDNLHNDIIDFLFSSSNSSILNKSIKECIIDFIKEYYQIKDEINDDIIEEIKVVEEDEIQETIDEDIQNDEINEFEKLAIQEIID